MGFVVMKVFLGKGDKICRALALDLKEMRQLTHSSTFFYKENVRSNNLLTSRRSYLLNLNVFCF